MKLQSFKRLNAEDFEEKERSLITRLGYSINTFAEEVFSALSNNLSIEDNFNFVKKDISLSLDKNGKIVGSLTFKSDLSKQCDGILVIKVINNSNQSIYPTGTPFISFTETSGNLITINNITNLNSNNQYTVKIIVF